MSGYPDNDGGILAYKIHIIFFFSHSILYVFTLTAKQWYLHEIRTGYNSSVLIEYYDY